MMSNSIIIRNSARCLRCGDEIVSEHRHDFRRCSCGGISVDGGTSYIRRLFTRDARWVDTSITIEKENPDAE